MKRSFFYSFVVLLLIFASGNSTAQDFKGGVVKYQQTTKYNWGSIFNAKGAAGSKVNAWIASLPKESKRLKILYFTEENALYKEDPAEGEEVLSKKLHKGLEKANYMRPPQAEIKKVFYDFGKGERTKQVEFMTRNFLVSDLFSRKAWKLTNKKIKVQDYICLGAELKNGDDKITAWFTSEIPVSTGPDEFFGLPGLILAVEINGETAYLATSIDLTPPKDGELSKPGNGKKVTQEEFDKIVALKIKENSEMKKSGEKKRRTTK